MLRIHFGDTPNQLTEQDWKRISQKCDGCSGSDMSVVVREALMCVRLLSFSCCIFWCASSSMHRLGYPWGCLFWKIQSVYTIYSSSYCNLCLVRRCHRRMFVPVGSTPLSYPTSFASLNIHVLSSCLLCANQVSHSALPVRQTVGSPSQRRPSQHHRS